MKLLHALIATAMFVPGAAHATDFLVTVSPAYADRNVVLALTNSTMDTAWFTQNAGGRTVYSSDVTIGRLTHGTGVIQAHATWVISYNPSTRTVNLNAGRTHITNWWGNQRCNVYEDGTCTCGNNQNWAICSYAPMQTYVTTLVAGARIAALNAQHALQQAGYTVTRN